MKIRNFFKPKKLLATIGLFFLVFFSLNALPAFAHTIPTQNSTLNSTTNTSASASCTEQIGAIGWLVCPGTGLIARMVDTMYSTITNLLEVQPLTTDRQSSIYLIWEYIRDFTNIVFIILLLVVVYSHLTGLGLSNYNIKRTLPRLIVGVILINLSFFLCSLAVDLSNIIGQSLSGIFTSIQEHTIKSGGIADTAKVSWENLFLAISGGAATGIFAINFTGGFVNLILAAIPILFSVLIAVVIGMLTIALRQSVIFLLVAISPLAFVAYLLPNTESYFKRWRGLFSQMLVFYPMFSLLFGASQLAGWALIASSNSALGTIFGMAIQILPLFLSIPMLKMSNTALSSFSNFINNRLSPIQVSVKNAVALAQTEAKARHFANSKSAGAHLQRYLEYRKTLSALSIEHNTTTTKSLATIRALYKISGGYDIDNPNKILKTNRYTRERKVSDLTKLAADTYRLDTEHSFSNYGTYHNKTAFDRTLSEASKDLWLEYNRAEFTNISDKEADFDELVKFYDRVRALGYHNHDYQKFIVSAGPETSVLGQLFAKASAVESRRRRDDAIVIAKYGFNLEKHRNMTLGYYNVDGWATDENGNRLVDENGKLLETFRGEAIAKYPDKLVLYDKADEKGIYYDMTDQKGNFVMRVYKNDSAFAKEAMSNFDIPINDSINDVYAILSGLEPDDEISKHLSLSKYSATIGRAIDSAGYKEKGAWASPMATSMVKNGYIKNFACLNLAKLNSLIKTTKPSIFNTQDSEQIKAIEYLLNPDNMYITFPEEEISKYLDVGGKPLGGYEYILDDDGNIQYNDKGEALVNNISAEDATYEQRLNLIYEKYMRPASKRFLNMMQRYSPNVSDNQKTSTGEALDSLTQMINQKFGDDAYRQPANFSETAREIAQRIRRSNPRTVYPDNSSNSSLNQSDYTDDPLINSNIDINEAFSNSASAEDFYSSVLDILNNYGLNEAASKFSEFYNSNPNCNSEELLDFISQELD